MNKFKLYHPLIMACFYLVLLLFIGYINFIMNNTNLAIVTINGFKIHLFMAIVMIGVIGFSAFLIIYTYYLQKWTKGNALSLKPPEINEEDEGTQQIYATATKRIYMFYTTVIPLLTVIAFFLHIASINVEAYMLVYVFLTILSIHYFIFYKVTREFFK
ncbi:hypothetical protein ACKXGF_14040 [Alkalibacillus sp. S2W]|uniref:hypothetical protein n=1 Tax=Alkalibacillus sp. S2W TaxID=3386553 RepID=UPI00398D2ACE